MLQTVNFPLSAVTAMEYGGWHGVAKECADLGLDGIEAIWTGETPSTELPGGLVQGYHLTFYPDWLDFYRGDKTALIRKYGSLDEARRFYGGGPETLMELYRCDLERAIALGARYVVFHVSDVSIEEGYTYRWLHSDEDVIDASAEIINQLLDGIAPSFDFLVENQWWAGFTFTEPDKTARLLDAIRYPRTGIMLDTGHLMNCNTVLRNQIEALSYIGKMLDRHGELCRRILGMHLHQSLSGAYVRKHIGTLPDGLPENSVERFGASYQHILQIDRHRPWTQPSVTRLIDRVSPLYLTHELSAPTREYRRRVLERQLDTIKRGTMLCHI